MANSKGIRERAPVRSDSVFRGGRPSKFEQQVKAAMEASGFGPVAEQLADIQFDKEVLFASELPDKMRLLSDVVRRKREALEDMLKSPEGSVLTGRPWLNSSSPADKLREVKQERLANQKVIDWLVSHLAMHPLIDLHLGRFHELAERELLALIGLPKPVLEFAALLRNAGLKASTAASVTAEEATMLVNYLEAGGTITDALRYPPVPSAKAKVKRKRLADGMGMAELEGLRDAVKSEPLPLKDEVDDTAPAVEKRAAEGMLDDEFWAQDLPNQLPYRWEYRGADDAEIKPLLGMRYPPVLTWAELRASDPKFELVTHPEVDWEESQEMMRGYLSLIHGLPENEVPEAFIKAWFFFLWGRNDRASAEKVLGAQMRRYFVGAKLFAPESGPDMVRELVRELE